MTLWGGGHREPPADALWRFTVSTADRRLLADDVAGSIAHVRMLRSVGLIDEYELVDLVDGLERIAAEAEAGGFGWTDGDEDVHTAVERRLGELVGEVAGKLHTGRSRNDQVALDIRLYLRRAAGERVAGLRELAAALVDQAEAAGERVVASYTHLQQAQAVPLGHHLLAHAWALRRDTERFADCRARLDVSPLGAGAGGGSSLPLDPAAVAESLGFGAIFDNSLDAVAARDVVAEYAFCCAQAMAHLSRLAEELVLWATEEFGWASFADAYTTGSSALPQKKNPDIAELARGRAAAVIGDVVALLALQKGLPLAYNRDLQEDKEAVFRADDALAGALEALTGMVASATLDPPPPSPWVTAYDLAELLVERGVPFREAHEVVGRLVADVAADGRTLADLGPLEPVAVHDEFESGDVQFADPPVSIRRRRTPGGGSFDSVRAQIAALRGWLTGEEEPPAS